MEKNNLIALILVLLIFVFAGIYFIVPEKQFSYAEEINGITFYSNSFSSPQKYFSGIVKERNSFLIITELDSKETLLPEVSAQLALASGIFSAAGKFVSSIIIVLDEKGNADYCQTNFGNASQNEKLTKRQCNNLIENSTEFQFIIKFPSGNTPSVEMYNNSVVINPAKKEEGLIILQNVFTAIYPNSKEITDEINRILHSVTS